MQINSQKILATKAKNPLGNKQDLPRFQLGQLITAQQLQAIPNAIDANEAALGLARTVFKPFLPGHALTAADLNQFINPLNRLSHRVGLAPTFRHFPLRLGDLITAEILNEIIDAINAIQHRM